MAADVDRSVIAELAYRLRQAQRPQGESQFRDHLRVSGMGPVQRSHSAWARRTDGANVQLRAGSGGSLDCYPDPLYVRGAPIEFLQLVIR